MPIPQKAQQLNVSPLFSKDNTETEMTHSSFLKEREPEIQQVKELPKQEISSKSQAEPETEQKKSKYADKFIFNFPQKERNELKKFCVMHDITMTDFIMLAIDYIKTEVEEERLNVSRYGIKKINK